jgi:hypothetical protein
MALGGFMIPRIPALAALVAGKKGAHRGDEHVAVFRPNHTLTGLRSAIARPDFEVRACR